MQTTKQIKAAITRTLKEGNRFTSGMEINITSLADSLRTLAICRNEIDGLTSATVEVMTRYGTKLEPHPVFKIQTQAQDQVIKACKLLGLTTKELATATKPDPFEEFIRDIESID